jgi:hypothetical protein
MLKQIGGLFALLASSALRASARLGGMMVRDHVNPFRLAETIARLRPDLRNRPFPRPGILVPASSPLHSKAVAAGAWRPCCTASRREA